ncbi:MAG: 4'-phosphopantetheinyl transferase superfamily protein [Deltaproteobacteria bacterium]|nr:4'-phosphopantetheinyl transferase superfamily protein [Deltaproteobacteria bacterium]
MRIILYYTRALDLGPVFQEGLNFLPSERAAKVMRLRNYKDQLRSLGASLMLRRFLGVTKNSDLTIEPRGKPYLTKGGIHFSLSHSGEFSALSLGSHPHGLDLEDTGRTIQADSLGKRVFSQAEQEVYQNFSQSLEIFLTLWTRKESLLKALGVGLGVALNKVTVVPLEVNPLTIEGRNWYFLTLKISGHLFTICSPLGPVEVTPVQVGWDDFF